MCGSMVDVQSRIAENRRGKKKKEEKTTAAKYSLRYWAAITIVQHGLYTMGM